MHRQKNIKFSLSSSDVPGILYCSAFRQEDTLEITRCRPRVRILYEYCMWQFNHCTSCSNFVQYEPTKCTFFKI